MKGTKLPTKDNEEDLEKKLLNLIFAPQCKRININLGASNSSLRNININSEVHASNDVNQGDSPKISSEERSCIENLKETKVPKNCICLDIEIFSPKKGWVNLIE